MTRHGFTLIEVLIVVALLAMLSVFAVPALRGTRGNQAGGGLRVERSRALRSGRAARMLDTTAMTCAAYITPDGMVLAETTSACHRGNVLAEVRTP